MKLHWSAAYVGIPWLEKGRTRHGGDCWSVIRLAFAEIHGIALPSYTEVYASTEEMAEMRTLFGKFGEWPWRAVEFGREREFDVAYFRRAGVAGHAGLITEPGEMLHVEHGACTHLERFDTGRWARRLLGIVRHTSLA